MTNDTNENEDLAKEIEQIISAHPHLENLLKAFAPLLLEKNQWLLDTAVDPRVFPIDPLRYADGVPLDQQHQLFLEDDPWGSAGWSAAKSIAQGFPHFSKDMEVLLGRFTEGKYDDICLFFTHGQEADEQLIDKAAALGISPTSLHLFLRVLNRFMLTKKARDMKMELAAHAWTKGYCPVCGGFPHLAILGDKGQRELQCADCGHAWTFSRLTCPYCNHEDPQNTNIFFIEGQPEDTAFTCDKCRRYLLTANRSASLKHPPADLIAMGLIHLDVILQEKDFRPMAECEWNGFPSSKK
ncbi:MAG: formate dehydrogenase accessory protein FdhE [Pseudomonadota bacterium]